MEKTKNVRIDVYTYSERELSQIIRRKMTTKSCKNDKRFSKNKDRKHFIIKGDSEVLCFKQYFVL